MVDALLYFKRISDKLTMQSQSNHSTQRKTCSWDHQITKYNKLLVEVREYSMEKFKEKYAS